MPILPLKVTREDYNSVRASIESAITIGGEIRNVLGSQSELNPTNDLHIDVYRALEALSVFGSRWTIVILPALYILAPSRFNSIR